MGKRELTALITELDRATAQAIATVARLQTDFRLLRAQVTLASSAMDRLAKVHAAVSNVLTEEEVSLAQPPMEDDRP